MSHLIVRHPVAFVLLGALGIELAWQLAAHAFLLRMGYTGIESWSWWIRSLMEMMMA